MWFWFPSPPRLFSSWKFVEMIILSDGGRNDLIFMPNATIINFTTLDSLLERGACPLCCHLVDRHSAVRQREECEGK